MNRITPITAAPADGVHPLAPSAPSIGATGNHAQLNSPADAAGAPNLSNPFARPDLWRAFRFVGYFQRETVAVFADSNGAVDFCLANIGTGNGFYVGEYRREAAHG